MEKLGLGVMISAISPDSGWLTKKAKRFPCALDNGAFGGTRDKRKCYDPHRFLATLHRCYQMGLELDFVVAPDRIGAGTDSLSMSVHWAKNMIPGSNLALALQDGMTPEDVKPHLHLFAVLFIGGSKKWKWQTAEAWINLAHDNDKRCHIGQVGTLRGLRRAHELGADSVDSASFVRNKRWDILEEFRQPTQMVIDYGNP